VFIIEISLGSVVAVVPITFAMVNADTKEKEVFDEAWQSAVEDNLVENKNSSFEP